MVFRITQIKTISKISIFEYWTLTSKQVASSDVLGNELSHLFGGGGGYYLLYFKRLH